MGSTGTAPYYTLQTLGGLQKKYKKTCQKAGKKKGASMGTYHFSRAYPAL
jgi:hypothetical protein